MNRSILAGCISAFFVGMAQAQDVAAPASTDPIPEPVSTWLKSIDNSGWSLLGYSDNFKLLVYYRPLGAVDGYKTSWIRFEDFEPKISTQGASYKSMAQIFQIDCTSKRYEEIHESLFPENNLRGDLVRDKSFPFRKSDLEYPIPGSFGETLLEKSCATSHPTRPRRH